MNIPWVRISGLSDYVDKAVTIKGWVYNKRSSGKIHFLQVRDGSGFIQGVMEKVNVTEELFALAKGIWIEASVEITGTVRKDERSQTGFELAVSDLVVISNPTEEYPITKKEHGIDFLLDNRHLWLRSPRQRAILTIRDLVILSCRQFMHQQGFCLVDSPILTGAIGEGADGLFELEYFDQGKAYLAQTGQLYLEAAAAALGRVYCFGPTFRAEKSKTRRHLTEFWMIEPEAAFFDHNDNMRLQENMVSYVIKEVLTHCPEELHILGREKACLERITPPFPRITYDDAVVMLQKLGSDIPYGDDFGGDDETILTQQFEKPVFVEYYPKQVKAFYMKQHPERPDLVVCDDLLAPEGYGEIIGGSQREDDYDRLCARIREHGLPEESYSWYLDIRKYGSFPHSGFGMGIERLVTWICGMQHIREAIPWPRTIYRIQP